MITKYERIRRPLGKIYHSYLAKKGINLKTNFMTSVRLVTKRVLPTFVKKFKLLPLMVHLFQGRGAFN